MKAEYIAGIVLGAVIGTLILFLIAYATWREIDDRRDFEHRELVEYVRGIRLEQTRLEEIELAVRVPQRAFLTADEARRPPTSNPFASSQETLPA